MRLQTQVAPEIQKRLLLSRVEAETSVFPTVSSII